MVRRQPRRDAHPQEHLELDAVFFLDDFRYFFLGLLAEGIKWWPIKKGF